jgi:hypothetical protein
MLEDVSADSQRFGRFVYATVLRISRSFTILDLLERDPGEGCLR